jgi:hypothetical protein
MKTKLQITIDIRECEMMLHLLLLGFNVLRSGKLNTYNQETVKRFIYDVKSQIESWEEYQFDKGS